jgi:hypothetical protein
VTPASLASYNARAQAAGLTTGGGQALRFVLPDDSSEGYEERAFRCGEVLTRPDNWHDAYNAEVWLEFPRAKAALNRLHADALRAAREAGQTARGRVRDRLTQFDECGVVITSLRGELWQALCEHRWREVFVEHRDEVRVARFHIFGHASRDLLRAPFPGICGKALWLDSASDELALVDELLARRLASADFQERWPALPLLGIPGITVDSEDPAYYDDVRQFRPPRTMAAGSSPDSR